MLRTFGVEKVSILAGGLEGWRAMNCRWSRACPNCRRI
jgi:3-mercaptopyruvate sulfurtransferase SseA